ncbi:hypothetical protein [Flavobacterium muglaense]|uniref:Uncharacterized protein n=1 Tax=Flavobacterium muglaense TaxID=2764716 RepID=A0A923N0H7_9FLAO|nr:hypothetical protein [Flavobacterium muglaense]MBC5838530.1 hypothetical protein [Flavobacterium muglaense]MBC5845064.1 hypothetical protein [Flavobacterium muglaense]
MLKVYCIYPEDKLYSLKFLNRVNTYFLNRIRDNWHCYKVKTNDYDHSKCIDSAVASNSKFILFMGHGRSDCLFGSCTGEPDEFMSFDAMIEQNLISYRNENFINLDNISKFKNKIFFSFSCNSNVNSKNSIGRAAIESGVLSFIGFGDIPTDYLDTNDIPLKAISIFKGIITSIIKKCILKSIEFNYSVQSLVDLIKLDTAKKIHQLILYSNYRHKDKVIENLYLFKNEITIFGDAMAKTCA